jgi:hypothetical protein
MASLEDGSVLLFGGRGVDGALGDTWSFDADEGRWSRWTSSSSSPPARWGHAMALAGDGSVLLFGGELDESEAGGTWRFRPARSEDPPTGLPAAPGIMLVAAVAAGLVLGGMAVARRDRSEARPRTSSG